MNSLHKLHSDGDFASATIPQGSAVVFSSTDSQGNVVLKSKDSSGNIKSMLSYDASWHS